MGTFNHATFADKLAKMNNTQASIETVSAWCVFFRKDARRVVDSWEQEFVKAQPQKKLTMIYLANHILQNSRKKGPEFQTEFFRVMPKAIRHMLKHGEEASRKAVIRLIAIWEERRVFGASGVKPFKELLADNALDSPAPKPPSQQAAAPRPPLATSLSAPASTVAAQAQQAATAANQKQAAAGAAGAAAAERRKFAQVEALAGALAEVMAAASHTRQLVEQCTQQLHKASKVEELAAAKALLQSYSDALDSELQRRQQAVTILRTLMQQQEEGMRKSQEQMRICKAQMQQFTARLDSCALPGGAAAQPAGSTAAGTGGGGSPAAAPGARGSAPGAARDWPPQSSAPGPSPLGIKPETGSATAGGFAATVPQGGAGVPPPLVSRSNGSNGSMELNLGEDGPGAAEAAQMAFQLASSGEAEALLAALAALPQEQQVQIAAAVHSASSGGMGAMQELRAYDPDNPFA